MLPNFASRFTFGGSPTANVPSAFGFTPGVGTSGGMPVQGETVLGGNAIGTDPRTGNTVFNPNGVSPRLGSGNGIAGFFGGGVPMSPSAIYSMGTFNGYGGGSQLQELQAARATAKIG